MNAFFTMLREVVITQFGHHDTGFILQFITNIQQQHIWRYVILLRSHKLGTMKI